MRIAPTLAMVCGVVLGLVAAAQARPGFEELTFDAHVFRQHDAQGGHPLVAEGMDYAGLQTTLRARINEDKSIYLNVSVAHIDNDTIRPPPASVNRASITSASTEILTLDAQIRLDFHARGSNWRFSPGIYYHHQHRDIRFGFDFAAVGELAGGDSVLTLSYGLRWGIPVPVGWDGDLPGRDHVLSHSLLVGLTQTLSASWVVGASLQYTRQDGLLTNHYNFVTIHDGTGTAVDLSTESLPRERDRVQLNLRGRWSPSTGVAFGLDSSGYLDNWGIEHASVEPNIEIPLSSKGMRLRLWYRFAAQSRVRYFKPMPTAPSAYQTQDADLDAWTMHGPGALVVFPLSTATEPGDPSWVGKVSLFGFSRSDNLAAAGAQIGTTATW